MRPLTVVQNQTDHRTGEHIGDHAPPEGLKAAVAGGPGEGKSARFTGEGPEGEEGQGDGENRVNADLQPETFSVMFHRLFLRFREVEDFFDGAPEIMGDFVGQRQRRGVAPDLDGGDGLPGGADGLCQLLLRELSFLAELADI